MSKYKLEMFMEQGSEGARWCIYDTTKKGYDGLIVLEDGMKINIIGKWQGVIKKDRETNKFWFYKAKPYADEGKFREMLSVWGYDTMEMSNDECEELAKRNMRQQVAGGYWCHWVQEGVNPDTWAQWFMDELDVELL